MLADAKCRGLSPGAVQADGAAERVYFEDGVARVEAAFHVAAGEAAERVAVGSRANGEIVLDEPLYRTRRNVHAGGARGDHFDGRAIAAQDVGAALGGSILEV